MEEITFAIKEQNHESKLKQRWWWSPIRKGGSYGSKTESFPCNIYLEEIIHVSKLSNVLFLRCHLFNSWKPHLHGDRDLFCKLRSKSDCDVLGFVLSSPFPLGSHYKSVHLKLILGTYVPLVNNVFCPVCDGVSEMVDSFMWGNKQ